MKNLISKLRKIKLTPKIYLDFPENPGVYVFLQDSIPIYVGKAINLKKRVSSYFRLNLEPKTRRMVGEATDIVYIKVINELEALLLEAKLIKYYLPKYNVAAKDDKHPLYIQITKEEYPRVITLRKADLKKYPEVATYGPFPSSSNVRSVLKMIRRIFAYSDHKLGKRGCLYSQIGLCNPCPNEISNIKNQKIRKGLKHIYIKNIRNIKSLLDGNILSLRTQLEKEMKKASSSQDYEEAGNLRDKIRKLEYITNPKTSVESYLENPNLFEDIRSKELAGLKQILKSQKLPIRSLRRIECFDVAHIQGTNTTASMVTFLNGIPDK
jgi:excinuclease ABC subunit C